MDFTKEGTEKMEFTNHILERYVERTMNKTGNEIKQFLAQNSEQIKQKILKLYEYSEPFWFGKIKDHDFAYFTINRDGWVIVIDKNKTTLITIYKVDLGLGVEFNKQYIDEMKRYVAKIMEDLTIDKNGYAELTEWNNQEIESLKNENKSLQTQIEHNNDKIKCYEMEKDVKMMDIDLKEKDLHRKIEKFIGSKIF